MKDQYFKYATETVVLSNFCTAFEEGCSRCSLSSHGCKPVIYRGNPKADILLLGEAPGKIEEKQGIPFVGPAGELLDKILSSIELGAENVFITNVVFCRPKAEEDTGKQNYTPKEEQIKTCWPFVENLIRIVKPKIIIACGKVALSRLLDSYNIKLSDYEGKWTQYNDIPVFVMTHPASLLYKSSDDEAYKKAKKKVWSYMKEFRDTWKQKMEKK